MKHDQWFRLFFKSSRYLCYMTSSFHLCSWLNYRLLIDIIFTHIILQIFLLNVDILRFQGKSEPSWPTFLDSDLQHTSSSAFWSAIKTNIIHWWPWVLFSIWLLVIGLVPHSTLIGIFRCSASSPIFTNLYQTCFSVQSSSPTFLRNNLLISSSVFNSFLGQQPWQSFFVGFINGFH